MTRALLEHLNFLCHPIAMTRTHDGSISLQDSHNNTGIIILYHHYQLSYYYLNNIVMFKSGIQGILSKSRSIMSRSLGSETQRIVASMIYDDGVEVLSSFEMNRIATLTFGDEVCGEIFDVLE